MAHFIGFVRGTRNEASRLGEKEAGIQTRAQGWKTGVNVIGRHVDGQDRFQVYATGGSGGKTPEQPVAVVGLTDGGELVVQLDRNHPVLTALEELLTSIGRCSVAPGALERAELFEEMNEAVAKARRAINENRRPNFARKAGAEA